jgi:hypothetical protein
MEDASVVKGRWPNVEKARIFLFRRATRLVIFISIARLELVDREWGLVWWSYD